MPPYLVLLPNLSAGQKCLLVTVINGPGQEIINREASPRKKKKTAEKQDKLDAILPSLTELKSDITACDSRISDMEAKNTLHEAAFSPLNRSFTDHEENSIDDQLSVVAGNDLCSLDDINGETQSLN